jgi:cyclophilin family peptidyl-prolyl cis-trans isomerase
MGFGAARPEPPPVGRFVTLKDGLLNGLIESETQKTVALAKLPKTTNATIKHDAAGVLGVNGPNSFYLTLKKNAGLDKKSAALGRIIAGASALQEITVADPIRSVRIVRVGQAARDFKTDDAAFKALMEKVTKK